MEADEIYLFNGDLKEMETSLKCVRGYEIKTLGQERAGSASRRRNVTTGLVIYFDERGEVRSTEIPDYRVVSDQSRAK